MKKITLLFVAAAIIGVGSAFTTASKATAGEYVYNGTSFVLRSDYPGGECDPLPGVCTWTKINESGSNTDQSNFRAADPGVFSF